MIVSYELEIRLDPAIRDSYLEWLPGHIDRVLQSPGFLSAEILEDDEDVLYVRYRVVSEEALESYFVNRASALRSEAEKYFGNRFEVRRRVLEHRLGFGRHGG